MAYEHPGRLFVMRYGPPESADDILHFASFLRAEAGLPPTVPLDLAVIRERFGIPQPKLKALPNQQGLLINPERGTIIINSDDPTTRQRFTESHELMELLFAALAPGMGWAARQVGGFQAAAKERLCNAGAAELLMPRAAVLAVLTRSPISIATAQSIAVDFRVSLTAALVQLVRVAAGCHAVTLWQMRHKPSEMRRLPSPDQLSLFGGESISVPRRKLRIVWSFTSPGVPYIASHKSAPANSAMVEAWDTGVFVERSELLDLGSVRGMVTSENLPFQSEDSHHVLSLLHLPGDTCS